MAGYWLNPDRGQCVQVQTTHDEWVRQRANSGSIGLSESVYEAIMQHPPTAIDEIRLLAVRAGLVRIREHRRYTSIQFSAPPERVASILRAVVDALAAVDIHPDTYLQIDNLLLNESLGLTIAALQQRLDGEQQIAEGVRSG